MILHENDLLDIDGLITKFDNAMQIIAQEVGTDLQKSFDRAIDIFYAAYSPTSYKRTKSMYGFSSGSPKTGKPMPLWKRNKKLDYTAGIKVGPENISGNPYDKSKSTAFKISGRGSRSVHGIDVDPAWVFDVSYMKGIHGFNRMNVIAKRTDKKKDDDDSGKTFRNNWAIREDKWEPGYYKSASWDFSRKGTGFNVWEHVPPTSTPPYVKMQKAYKEICKSVGARVDRVMDSLL